MLRCAITDGSRFPSPADRRSGLLADATRWAASGIDFVQLREKNLPTGELVHLARELITIFRAHNAPTKLLLNSRPDIAAAAGADGVHLTSSPGALTPTQVRHIFAASTSIHPLVSISCHTLAEVEQAAALHADLILFAPVFEKRLNDILVVPGTGLDLLRQACAAVGNIPVLALGGITAENTPSCLAAGAAGIAAIRLFS